MKKIVSLLLLAIMVISVSGCLTEEESADISREELSEKSEALFSEESKDEENEKNIDLSYGALDKKDLGGREIHIIERWFGFAKNSIDHSGEVLYMEDQDGNLSELDQTKASIIDQVQKDYNCKIEGKIFGEGSVNIIGDLKALITADIMSKTYKYDFFFESIYCYTSLAFDGMLSNFKDIETINLQSSCWDQNAVSELSINNHLYFMTGDINTYDNRGTVAILFNKKLYEKAGYTEDLYKLVREREWTFDKLVELSERFEVGDINKDGKIDQYDQWFMGSETGNLYYHVAAAGEGICKKDENDVPQLTMTSEKGIEALVSAINFYKSGKVLVSDLPEYSSKYEIFPLEGREYLAFLESRELFFMTDLLRVPYFRQMEDEFGILPVPMYSKEQGEYYSRMRSKIHSALMIPSSPRADEDLGLVIQALAELSEEILTPSFYEKMLCSEDSKDEESEEILDIIFNNRHYDLGALMCDDFGNPEAEYAVLETDNIKAKFEEKEKNAKAFISDFVQKFKD